MCYHISSTKEFPWYTGYVNFFSGGGGVRSLGGGGGGGCGGSWTGIGTGLSTSLKIKGENIC